MEMRFSVEWAGISCRGVGGGDVAAVEVIARHHTPNEGYGTEREWIHLVMDSGPRGTERQRNRRIIAQTDEGRVKRII